MKIKYSALVSDARGKLNGSVASKNRYGSYLRNKITPVNPQSTAQMEARQRFGALSSMWKSLTQSQRNSWLSGVKAFPFTDIFGDIKHLSGNSLFVKLNSNLEKIGSAPILSAPEATGVSTLPDFELSPIKSAGVLTGLQLEFSDFAVPSGESLVVYATPPQGPGKNFVKSEYRFIGTATVDDDLGDIFSIYASRFGTNAPANQKIFVRIALVNTTTGEQGVPLESVATL